MKKLVLCKNCRYKSGLYCSIPTGKPINNNPNFREEHIVHFIGDEDYFNKTGKCRYYTPNRLRTLLGLD